MSARDGILNHLTGRSLCPPPRPDEEAAGLLDAYRAEVLREAEDRLRERAGELSDLAEQEMRHDLEEKAQLWHEAADELSRMADEQPKRAGA